MEKSSIFTSGHCAGTVAGTVRALCGHCAGTVECARQYTICYICSTCLLGGHRNEQQASAAAGKGSAAFAKAAAKDFRLACRVHDGFARAQKASCHFCNRSESHLFATRLSLKLASDIVEIWFPNFGCRRLSFAATAQASLPFPLTVWMEGTFLLTCLANFMVHSCSAFCNEECLQTLR